MNQDSPDLFKSPLKFNAKKVIVLILVLIGLYLLLPKLVGVEQAIRLLDKVNKYYLILAIIAEIISYSGAAWLLGIIFSRLGYKLPFASRYKLGSLAAFTVHFLPLGVAGEAAFEYSYLRKTNVDSSSVLLMWILRWVFNYSAFFILLLIGLILVPIYPAIPLTSKVFSPIILVLIVLIVYYLIYLYQHKEKFWQVWTNLFSFVNKVILRFKKKPVVMTKQTEIFDNIYKGISIFGQKKRSSAYAVLAGMIYWLGDITCLYFVFHSFGFSIHWGVLILGYCVATLLGILSAVPGGIGVVEGSMALIFAGMGVPGAIALTAILVFRLFSFWIWIPIGFFSYLSLQNSKLGIQQE